MGTRFLKKAGEKDKTFGFVAEGHLHWKVFALQIKEGLT